MTGKLHFDWGASSLKLEYDRNGYSELMKFNDVRGRTSKKEQIFYQQASGSICGSNCQQSTLNFEMPPMDRVPTSSISSYTASGGLVTVNGKSAQKYNNPSTANEPFMVLFLPWRKSSSPQINSIWLEGSNLVQFQMKNGRLYTILDKGAMTGSLAVPTGCKCQAKLDIILRTPLSPSLLSPDPSVGRLRFY